MDAGPVNAQNDVNEAGERTEGDGGRTGSRWGSPKFFLYRCQQRSYMMIPTSNVITRFSVPSFTLSTLTTLTTSRSPSYSLFTVLTLNVFVD
jgi:hypothetical protein